MALHRSLKSTGCHPKEKERKKGVAIAADRRKSKKSKGFRNEKKAAAIVLDKVPTSTSKTVIYEKIKLHGYIRGNGSCCMDLNLPCIQYN